MSDDEKEKVVTLEEARQAAGNESFDSLEDERGFEFNFDKLSSEIEFQYAHLKGLEDHYTHKGYWSWFLMATLAGMVIFQSYLLYKVGSQQWSFEKYEWR